MTRLPNRRLPILLTWLLVVLLGMSLASPIGGSAQDVDRVQTGDAQPTQPVLEPPAATETPVSTDEPAEETPDTPTETPEPTAESTATETPVPTNEPVATETPVATDEPVATDPPAPTEPRERPQQPDASPTVEDDSEFAAAAVTSATFDQATYAANPGGMLTVILTITMDGPTTGGSAAMIAPPLTSISNVVPESTGSATCTAFPIVPPAISWAGLFDATGAGTCVYTVSMQIDPAATIGDLLNVTGTVSTATPAAYIPLSTMIVVAAPVENTLSVSLSNTDPVPGETMTVTVYHYDPGPGLAIGTMSGTVPDGLIVVPDSTTLSCSVGCTVQDITETAGMLSGSYLPVFGPTGVTMTYQVTVPAGTPPGTTFSIEGNGTVGLPPQPTGPAETSFIVAVPLMASDREFTVAYQGTLTETLTATGGESPLTFAAGVDGPEKGQAAIAPDGTFVYTADPGEAGMDILTYTVTDSGTPSQVATGTITITIDEPDVLVATTLTIEAVPLAPVSGNLNDQVSGGIPPYSFTVATGPTLGTLALNPDGAFTYTADRDAQGTDSFTYLVTDSQAPEGLTAAATTSGTVTILIAAAPPPTPTLEPGVTPTPTDPVLTPSPTLAPGVTPTATSDDGAVGPGDPEGDETPVDPRSTETPSAGAPGHRDDEPITRLPSTGQGEAGSDAPTMTLLLMLVGAILVGASAALARRRAGR